MRAAERACRLDVLQRAGHEFDPIPFDPIPFDTEAARAYGRVMAAVIAAGGKPRRRAFDLMIAATAIAVGLPLCTTNPDYFARLGQLLTVVSVGPMCRTTASKLPDNGAASIRFGDSIPVTQRNELPDSAKWKT